MNQPTEAEWTALAAKLTEWSGRSWVVRQGTIVDEHEVSTLETKDGASITLVCSSLGDVYTEVQLGRRGDFRVVGGETLGRSTDMERVETAALQWLDSALELLEQLERLEVLSDRAELARELDPAIPLSAERAPARHWPTVGQALPFGISQAVVWISWGVELADRGQALAAAWAVGAATGALQSVSYEGVRRGGFDAAAWSAVRLARRLVRALEDRIERQAYTALGRTPQARVRTRGGGMDGCVGVTDGKLLYLPTIGEVKDWKPDDWPETPALELEGQRYRRWREARDRRDTAETHSPVWVSYGDVTVAAAPIGHFEVPPGVLLEGDGPSGWMGSEGEDDAIADELARQRPDLVALAALAKGGRDG